MAQPQELLVLIRGHLGLTGQPDALTWPRLTRQHRLPFPHSCNYHLGFDTELWPQRYSSLVITGLAGQQDALTWPRLMRQHLIPLPPASMSYT